MQELRIALFYLLILSIKKPFSTSMGNNSMSLCMAHDTLLNKAKMYGDLLNFGRSEISS